ncbi:lupus La protein [Nematocida sp. AWRm79]|nr:lupus La protein [Nematocida sp. AWRm79]
MAPENKQIIQQVEFYFSDANIVRDEYLKKVIQANDGWVPLSVINSFSKIKTFSKTIDQLEEILKESEKLKVVEGKIQRVTPPPSFDEHKGDERTLIIKNFPSEYTLEDVQNVLSPFSARIARIAMRKDALKEFKGSVFVEMNEKDDMEILLEANILVDMPVDEENSSNSPAKKAKIQLEVSTAEEYFAKKKEAKKEEKEKKKQEVQKVVIDSFKNKIFKFTAERAEQKEADEKTEVSKEVSEEEISAIKISDIKAALGQGVAFVDVPSRHIRMKQDTEEISPVEINTLKLSFNKLSDEEVVAYCDGLSLTKGRTLYKPRRKQR